MHYALGMPLPPPPIIYPDVQPALAPPTPTPPSRAQSDSAVPSASSTSTGQTRVPRTPQPPKLAPPTLHRRAQSSPPPSSVTSVGTRTPGTVQCSGVTNAGKRCTRKCKSSLGADEDVFCHQHIQAMNSQMTIYDRKSNTHKISFSDDTTAGHVHLKVGRATNLNRRIDQWGKQCGSKEQLLRGWWPSAIETDETSFMKGRIQAGDKGAWCHRLERLVHIELADLATNRPYLDPAFPNNVVDPANAVKGTPKKNAGKPDIKRCPDCNTAHREIFTFERVKAGRYRGKEWDLIVKPVIEKWGGYVEAYV
ncbi:hypothetical protein EWM64_g2886 [Hericium alpestre]|uniref:Bacteriophage T5 Orf172 DNA-binding domain-containing protein n=1 Tax=Hericium alpestre TaxID=135208 RepID=A0A4Z0A4F6_9AGAM|nr:hypothetical protein EWM64_g2886 [Hericium alpestre]